MRRWIVLAAKLYPRPWRERYGVEFDALLQDVEPDGRELANVLGGAFKMQLRSETAYLKAAVPMAIVGAIAAAVLSVPMERYVSSAAVRITPPPPGGPQAQSTDLISEILSRNSLAELMTRPSLNLYPRERMRISLEDVVENMRRDIEIRRIPGSGQASTTIGISFSYPDRFKAQAVTRELVAKLLEGNQLVHRNRELMWRNAWHEAAPRGETVEVLAPANDPREPAPNLLSFAALGLGVGAALGLLAVTALRQPKRAMHLAAFAAGGCALAASASFLLPNRYVSTAVMRFTGPADPIRWYAGRTVEPVAAHVQRIADSVLSRKSLEGIAAKVKLDAGETANLRRGVSIEMLPPALGAGETGSAFRVSSTRGDPRKAQLVVREIVTGFFESYIVEQRSLAKTAGPDFRLMADHKMGENLEVLDPASLYEAPVWPNRFVIAAAGSAAGLLLGAFTFRRRPPGPAIQDAAAAPAI